MSEISAKQVSDLRKTTGAGMMDAKRALEEAAGDMERAKELLREKGLASAKKRTGRATEQGSIGSYLHYQADRPVIGVLVELASETDFVAKSEEFKETADDIAMHVSWSDPGWVSRDDVPEEVVARERELIAKQAELEGKPADVIDRIVAGKIESWYTDNVLTNQKFVNAEKFDGTVGDMIAALAAKMGENISIREFARVKVGS